MSAAANFNRPGVTDRFLSEAGCHHVGEEDCAQLYGCKGAGIVIPFRDRNGHVILDGDKPFVRVRLDHETDNQKYHQRRGSGGHIYIPPGFKSRAKRSTLIIVEGEFKALALDESGYCVLGLCGIHGAVQNVEVGRGETSHKLHDELFELLKFHQPGTLVFAGDADVALNSQFTVEASKLRRLICGARQFDFVEKIIIAKPPLNGPKGFDDCRDSLGANFNQWFDALLENGFEVEAKTTPVEVFCCLLKREMAVVQKLLAGENNNTHRMRVKLLNSVAQLQHDPAAMLSLRPVVAEVLGVNSREITGLIRDASKSSKKKQRKEGEHDEAKLQGAALTLPEIVPWDSPVSGREILTEIASTLTPILESGQRHAVF